MRDTLPRSESAMSTRIFGKITRLVALSVVGAVGGASAFAQSGSPAQALIENTFVFNAGVFVLGTDLSATLNGQSTSNPSVDFDQTFGKGSDASRARIDAMWRITPQHHVRFAYFNNTVTRNRVLDKDINWDDTTFSAGANTESRTKYAVYELSYEYAFLHTPTYEVAGGLGIHFQDMSLRLSGTATITDSEGNVTSSGSVSKSSSLPAPLPVIGVRAGWAVAPQIFLEAQAQIFKVSIDGYNGNWSDMRANATWMFSRNFGVGIGYDRFATRVNVSKSNFDGNLKLTYSGLQAFLTGTF
jgi:hypothetical protein